MLGDKLYTFKNNLRYWMFWLSVRQDNPNSWFKGSYSRIKILRFLIAIISLLSFSTGLILFTNEPTNTNILLSLWSSTEAAFYIITAIIFLLGLRIWYAPALLFFVANVIADFLLEGDEISEAFGNTSMFAALVLWSLLIVGAAVAMRYDKGSDLNSLLEKS